MFFDYDEPLFFFLLDNIAVRALRDFAKRNEVIVATKFLLRTQDDIAAGITGQQHIERMINKSLVNLGMDYVDLCVFHGIT